MIMQKHLKTALILLSLAGITGCQSFPYKAPIQQGNVITRDMVAKLQPGMTPEHVRYVLGEPILVPTFHPQRWEYIYTNQPSKGKLVRRLVTVYFKNGVMEKVSTEAMPAAKPVVKA